MTDSNLTEAQRLASATSGALSSTSQGISREEVQNMIEDEVAKYYRMSRPGFEVSSNVMTDSHGVAEFELNTDEGQGMHLYKSGSGKMVTNKSFEIISGDDAKEKDLGIGIHAENGHVYIRALNGDLFLEGNNVIIKTNEADNPPERPKGSVNIDAHERIDIGTNSTPNLNLVSTRIVIKGTKTLEAIGGKTNIFSKKSDVEISDGTEILIGSVDQLIANVDKYAKLFE